MPPAGGSAAGYDEDDLVELGQIVLRSLLVDVADGREARTEPGILSCGVSV